MALFTSTHANAVTDKLCALYNAMYGTSGSGFGLGDGTFGASGKTTDLLNILTGSTVSAFIDATLETTFVPAALNYPAANLANTVFANLWNSFFGLLDQSCSKSSGVSSTITNLDTLMYWYNYGNGSTYWQCLASPDWYWVYSAVKGGNVPNKLNLYYVITQGQVYRGVTFTNAMALWTITGASTGTLTAGASVPATHAGSLAYAKWSGVTGSGLVTVVGLDQSGNAETWTGTTSGASGSVQLTPQTHSYSLITAVTSVACAAGLTAGSVYIESHAPAGRTFPST